MAINVLPKTKTPKGEHAMRTRRVLYPETSEIYICELDQCPLCGEQLELSRYSSGHKIVQNLSSTVEVGYWPKQCDNPSCINYKRKWRSAEWQQIAPMHCTYGFDVITTIGWQRQTSRLTFEDIHSDLAGRIIISESQVRHLYQERYLPLLASQERTRWDELEQVSQEFGLILSLDGLAPEGGEPQLWVVRELQTGVTLRSGWLSEQGQHAFENFLRPIVETDLTVRAVLSDKQRGLLPAVNEIFPEARHAFCQLHYLKNIAEPAASADETMKVELRKTLRQNAGDIIRPEHVEQPGVLTVTGLLPSAVIENPAAEGKTEQHSVDQVEQERHSIVDALIRRVRYLLTLKGRPPFRMAGIEMYQGFRELCDCLEVFIAHIPDERLIRLQHGLSEALKCFTDDYDQLSEVAGWLIHISTLLDPEENPYRTGDEVENELVEYLDQLLEQNKDNPTLFIFASKICKTTGNYASGLFHTYDVPTLPRTNNDRESEFRGLNQRLLRTTGQKGATKRMIQRSGAWELIPRPGSLEETISAFSSVDMDVFREERQRLRNHRSRFKLHTRSGKRVLTELEKLTERWLKLPQDNQKR